MSSEKPCNNYSRPEGQNVGNFITGRSTSRVSAPPGGKQSFSFIGNAKEANETDKRKSEANSTTSQSTPIKYTDTTNMAMSGSETAFSTNSSNFKNANITDNNNQDNKLVDTSSSNTKTTTTEPIGNINKNNAIQVN